MLTFLQCQEVPGNHFYSYWRQQKPILLMLNWKPLKKQEIEDLFENFFSKNVSK